MNSESLQKLEAKIRCEVLKTALNVQVLKPGQLNSCFGQISISDSEYLISLYLSWLPLSFLNGKLIVLFVYYYTPKCTVSISPSKMSAAAAFIPTELDNYIFISPRRDTVWIGLDKRTNENVLIRVIERNHMSEKDLSGLTAEIALLQKLDHPLIAKFHEIVSTDQYFFVVTDSPKSNSVREYITEHGRVTEDKAREFLVKYVELTDYLTQQTSRTFILTIDAVFVDDACTISQVYVYYENSTFASEVDRQFRAPEVLNSQQYGPPASIWCMGVLLYFITTGSLPFGGKDEQEIDKNVLSRHPEFPDFLSPNLTAFLAKLLTKNPVTRITMKQFSSSTWMKEAPSSVLSSLTSIEKPKRVFMTDFRLAASVKQSRMAVAGQGDRVTDDESSDLTRGDGKGRGTPKAQVRLTPRKFMPLSSKGKGRLGTSFLGNLK